MIRYFKTIWISSNYKEYGQLMGEVLTGQLVLDIHDYFQLKQKYFKTTEQLLGLDQSTPSLEAWIRFSGGWSKKYPQVIKYPKFILNKNNEYKIIMENDILILQDFESKNYKQF